MADGTSVEGEGAHKCPICGCECREMSEEMEALGDDLTHAREEKRLAEAYADQAQENYQRLRRTISAAVMQ